MKADIIFVGGGLNYVGAIFLARAGKKVILIEKDNKHIGGTCLNNGCIPSKNLLHRTKTIFESKEDIFDGEIKINLKKLNSEISETISNLSKAIHTQIGSSNVEIIEGEGILLDDKKVEVNGEIYEADYIVLGTGAKPFIPKEIEIDYKHIITSDEIFKLEKFPKEITVYGTGAIGLEFAGFFAINGVKTTLMYRKDTISKKIHPKIVEKLELQLKEIGITLMPNTSINSAKVDKNKVIINENIKTDMLLVATGRKPNIESKANIEIKKGFVTNEYFETSIPNVFAIGDCNGKLELAHAARSEVLNVVDTILGKKQKLNLDNIPKFIYTIPLSYASVGVKSDKEVVYPLKALGITSAVKGSENGIVVLYADKENFLTGTEILMPNAEEIISTLAIMVNSELDKDTILKTTFPHPVFSEIFDYATRKIK